MSQIFIELNQKLVQNKVIDTKNSGSTGILAFIHQAFVACASLGDSQAFLYSEYEDGRQAVKVEELSSVHTPDSPEEYDRICRHGGTIHRAINKYGDESGPLRVFQGNSKVPGLMMTRSFGDDIGHSVGMISKPGKR